MQQRLFNIKSMVLCAVWRLIYFIKFIFIRPATKTVRSDCSGTKKRSFGYNKMGNGQNETWTWQNLGESLCDTMEIRLKSKKSQHYQMANHLSCKSFLLSQRTPVSTWFTCRKISSLLLSNIFSHLDFCINFELLQWTLTGVVDFLLNLQFFS